MACFTVSCLRKVRDRNLALRALNLWVIENYVMFWRDHWNFECLEVFLAIPKLAKMLSKHSRGSMHWISLSRGSNHTNVLSRGSKHWNILSKGSNRWNILSRGSKHGSWRKNSAAKILLFWDVLLHRGKKLAMWYTCWGHRTSKKVQYDFCDNLNIATIKDKG